MRYALLFLLLLASCSGSPTAVERFVGHEGLDVSFAQGAPGEVVAEGLPFPVKIYVHNKGALDLSYDDLLLTFSTDPVYIARDVARLDPREGDPTGELIYGRSIVYAQGERQLFELPASQAFVAKTVVGTREHPKTEISASACYRYTTTFSEQVCIDSDPYGQNLRAQPCEQEDLSDTRGQGAPVSIPLVEVSAIPVISALSGAEAVRPSFTIHVRDHSSGRIIGPGTLEMATACFLIDVPKEDLSTVELQAWLLDSQLECMPERVKLFGGEGKTTCTVSEEDLASSAFSANQNFQSILSINLSYIYKTTATAPIEIRRVDNPQVNIPLDGKITGYQYDGDQIMTIDGRRVTTCEYYAANPDEAPSDVIRDLIGPGFSCRCEPMQCDTNTRGGVLQCINKALCPNNFICCGEVAEESEEPPELSE